MSATGQETGAPAAMERSPASAAAQQGRRASTVVERKLDELCGCLDNALSSSSPGSLSPDADGRLVEDIKKRTDFLRSLLVAEGECHVAGARPQYLVEAEARFAVLEAAFDQWARRVGAAPAVKEEEEEEMERLPEEEEDGGSGSVSGTESECSCTDSLQEAAEGDADRVAVEAPVDAAPEATTDMNRDSVVTREEAAPVAVAKKPDTECAAVTPDANAKKRDAEHQAAAEKKRRTVQRCWWRRSAAWCGAAGVVAVVAVGVAVELAAVAHHNVNVYVVPT